MMTITLRIFFILVSIVSMISMIRKIRKSKMQIEYTIFWIIVAGLLIIIAIFPQIAMFFSELLGFQTPANFVFAFTIFILFIKVFMMTVEISTLEAKIKELTQKMALNIKNSEEK